MKKCYYANLKHRSNYRITIEANNIDQAYKIAIKYFGKFPIYVYERGIEK